ncbi:MAG: hypothetical protein ND895_22385 [Pyrinomonadaceae bacterium]|nr:hypothetical protein [Pyrinomonadaceae bacterium]
MKRIIMTSVLALMLVSMGCNRASSNQPLENASLLPPEIVNTVEGSVTFNGETVKVSHAYASVVKNDGDDRKQNVVIIFTDRPAPWGVIDQNGSDSNFKEKARQGELKGFTIRIAEDKTVNFTIYYHGRSGDAAYPSSLSEEYPPAKAVFKSVSFTATLVQGSVSVKSEKPVDDEKAEYAPSYQFDATFAVSLKPDKWTGVFYKPPPSNLEPGRATGQLVVDGKVMKLNYAYALQSRLDLFEETNANFVITEKLLPPEALKGANLQDLLRAAHQAGNSHVISENFSTRGAPPSPQVWKMKDPQNAESWDYDSLLHAEVEVSQLDAKAIDGKIYTKEPFKWFDHTYEVNVSFNAPLITSGDPMDGPVTVGTGKPLPAGGDDPGKAYLTFIQAVPTTKNLKELTQLLEASQAARVFAETKKSMTTVPADKEQATFEILKSLLTIKDARVDGGFWTNDKATLWISGTDEGKKASARVNMHLENNLWKVGAGSTRVD